MPAISAVIITLNEERNIVRCIHSLRDVADEIVVIDSLSSDHTVALAMELGARVVEQAFLGYREQKNFAMEQAGHEIILSIDADEAISEELKESILKVKDRFEADGYTMNRLTNYCGKWIRHGGWYPDRKLRLYKKGTGTWRGTNPHDRFELDHGLRAAHLKGDLLHYSFYDIEQHKRQIERFSEIASKAKFEQGVRSNRMKMVVKPIARFLKGYVLKLGFLDGRAGWLIATFSAYATYLKYRKLRQLHKAAK